MYDGEAEPMKSQLYGCPSKTHTMTTLVDMPVGMGAEHLRGPPLDEEL